jgi:branched-chain amino acid transport system ATP-binding protein
LSLLEVEELRVGYGLLPVLHGVSFSVEEGTTTVILGLNGAGKTTTVNTVAGLLSPWSGAVRFAGHDVSGLPAERLVPLGISLCPEGRRVFSGLSVQTNLELGAWTKRTSTKSAVEQVFGYFPALAKRAGQAAGTLSGGEQQMLAIGRALMARPRLLLVDEASLGLAPIVARTLFSVLRQITGDGTTVVAVEQNVGILAVADRALVIEKGQVVEDTTASALASSDSLRRTYLGSAPATPPVLGDASDGVDGEARGAGEGRP